MSLFQNKAIVIDFLRQKEKKKGSKPITTSDQDDYLGHLLGLHQLEMC